MSELYKLGSHVLTKVSMSYTSLIFNYCVQPETAVPSARHMRVLALYPRPHRVLALYLHPHRVLALYQRPPRVLTLYPRPHRDCRRWTPACISMPGLGKAP